MEQYVKLAINGGQQLKRCQAEKSQRRGGGQCTQAACAGSDYCWSHDMRGRSLSDSIKARFDRHAGNGGTVSEFLDEHRAAVRWLAIVEQFARQTAVIPKGR